MEMEFADFMMQLDGNKHSDFALIINMFHQCERVYRETGKPIAIHALKTERMVYVDEMWGKETLHVLDVYADDHGVYKEFLFATKPIYDTKAVDELGRPIWSEYMERKYSSKPAMAQAKSLFWSLDVNTSECITKAVYPGAQAFNTKQIIEGTYEMWTRLAEDYVFCAETA